MGLAQTGIGRRRDVAGARLALRAAAVLSVGAVRLLERQRAGELGHGRDDLDARGGRRGDGRGRLRPGRDRRRLARARRRHPGSRVPRASASTSTSGRCARPTTSARAGTRWTTRRRTTGRRRGRSSRRSGRPRPATCKLIFFNDPVLIGEGLTTTVHRATTTTSTCGSARSVHADQRVPLLRAAARERARAAVP